MFSKGRAGSGMIVLPCGAGTPPFCGSIEGIPPHTFFFMVCSSIHISEHVANSVQTDGVVHNNDEQARL